MDLLDEARLALFSQRARLMAFESPSADDMLHLATLGGADALGLADVVGSLEVGKAADLAAFAIAGAHPVHDAIAAAVYSIRGSDARFVAVGGRPLLRDGVLLNPNPGVSDRVERSARALREWLAAGGEMAQA
jgi:5-methylthioadenosine/S-adenosylhomocysteine deaminase